MPFQLSRRGFISAAAGSGSLVSLVRETAAEAASTPGRRATRIHVLYAAGVGAKWPSPDVDAVAESREYQSRLIRLAGLWRSLHPGWDYSVEFVGGEVVGSEEELVKCWSAQREIDGLLIVSLSQVRGVVPAALKLDCPKIFYFPSPSTAGFVVVGRAIREGSRACMVYSSDLGEIEPYVRAIDTLRRLGQSKILCLTTQSQRVQSFDPDKMRAKFGVQVQPMDFTRLNRLFEGADEAAATRLAEEFCRAAVRVVEPSRQEIIDAHKFYLAVKRLLQEEAATVITIDWQRRSNSPPVMPALMSPPKS
ncbi:MAG: hypothetical protein HXY20_03845 [Acidobacteria bacterium]|nr:hypothetical protein [Acidobacteriota bacterium]